MPEFVAVVRIGLSVILKIVHRAFHAILKTAHAGLAARILLPIRIVAIAPSVHQFRHCHLISAAKAIPISIAKLAGNLRMTELVPVVGIGPAVVSEILDGAFHAVSKPAAPRLKSWS